MLRELFFLLFFFEDERESENVLCTNRNGSQPLFIHSYLSWLWPSRPFLLLYSLFSWRLAAFSRSKGRFKAALTVVRKSVLVKSSVFSEAHVESAILARSMVHPFDEHALASFALVPKLLGGLGRSRGVNLKEKLGQRCSEFDEFHPLLIEALALARIDCSVLGDGKRERFDLQGKLPFGVLGVVAHCRWRVFFLEVPFLFLFCFRGFVSSSIMSRIVPNLENF